MDWSEFERSIYQDVGKRTFEEACLERARWCLTEALVARFGGEPEHLVADFDALDLERLHAVHEQVALARSIEEFEVAQWRVRLSRLQAKLKCSRADLLELGRFARWMAKLPEQGRGAREAAVLKDPDAKPEPEIERCFLINRAIDRGREDGIVQGKIWETQTCLIQVLEARFAGAVWSKKWWIRGITDLGHLESLHRLAAREETTLARFNEAMGEGKFVFMD